MIIGLTGKNAAGKGVAAEYLKTKGFITYSLSDAIRSECKSLGIEPTRENMIKIGNELREKFGFGALAVKTSEKINEQLKKNPNANFAVDSIRSPHEVDELAKLKDFVLVGIHAPIEIRFQRMLKRGRAGDAKTLDELKEMEQKENSKSEFGQQLDKTFSMSQKIIDNDSTIQELHKRIDEFLNNHTCLLQSGKMGRVSWENYFMNIAKQVATRSTCDRKHVGALIVKDKTILSTGYNGSIRGMPHCDEIGHMIEDGHCVATIHAETNAVLQAAKNGVRIEGAEVYITASPCWNCFKMVANAGIKKVYYGEFYRDNRIFEVARKLGIELIHIPVDQKEL